MTSRPGWLPCIALLIAGLPTAAPADEIEAPAPQVQQTLQKPEAGAQAAQAIVPESPGGWGEPPGDPAIQAWRAENPWGYGTEALFPLTRDLAASDLALWAKIPVYPLAGAYDLIQLPAGLIGGLWGR